MCLRRILDSDDTRGYLSGSDGMGSDLDNIRTINSPGQGWPHQLRRTICLIIQR
jgi:hypothetical protein